MPSYDIITLNDLFNLSHPQHYCSSCCLALQACHAIILDIPFLPLRHIYSQQYRNWDPLLLPLPLLFNHSSSLHRHLMCMRDITTIRTTPPMDLDLHPGELKYYHCNVIKCMKPDTWCIIISSLFCPILSSITPHPYYLHFICRSGSATPTNNSPHGPSSRSNSGSISRYPTLHISHLMFRIT